MNVKITSDRKKILLNFCKRADIKFRDLELLNHAFYHRSAGNEIFKTNEIYNNERLEFLGDSVLGMVCASYLFTTLDNKKEGDLAKIKSAVVSEKALAPIALQLGIDTLLILGHGEEMTGGRTKPAILADCMEAIIGAYYIDAGYKNAEQFVLSFLIPEIEKVLKIGTKDFKSKLQELVQQKFKLCPVYELLGTVGPEHEKEFKYVVHIGKKTYGPATGKNKKTAEQNVAEVALNALK